MKCFRSVTHRSANRRGLFLLFEEFASFFRDARGHGCSRSVVLISRASIRTRFKGTFQFTDTTEGRSLGLVGGVGGSLVLILLFESSATFIDDRRRRRGAFRGNGTTVVETCNTGRFLRCLTGSTGLEQQKIGVTVKESRMTTTRK